MIHFIDKVLENLRPYIPLMQTAVWPIVAVFIALRFQQQIRNCVDEIKKRIVAGAYFKLWLLELGSMTPATIKEQNDKILQETPEKPKNPVAGEKDPPNGFNKDSLKIHMLAEDLVLKKLSSELNLNITRHVKNGRDPIYLFDGVALSGKGFVAIEVKMVRESKEARMVATRTLDRLNTYYSALTQDAKQYFTLVLVIVTLDADTEAVLRDLCSLHPAYPFTFRPMCYQFNDLKAEFNIE